MKHIKQILALLITLGLLASLVIPTVSAADTGVAPAEPVETVAAEESPPEESTEPEAATEPSGETEETDQSEEISEVPAEPTEPTAPPETEATEATEETEETETAEETHEDAPQTEPTEEDKSLHHESNAEPQAAGTSIVHGKGITTVGTLTIGYYNYLEGAYKTAYIQSFELKTLGSATVYCLEPEKTSPGQNYTAAQQYAAWQKLPRGMRYAIGLALAYGYPNQHYSASPNDIYWYGNQEMLNVENYFATQLIIWEILSGVRSSYAPYALTGSTSYRNAFDSGWATIRSTYDAIAAKMAKHNGIPAYAGDEFHVPIYELQYDTQTGTYRYLLPAERQSNWRECRMTLPDGISYLKAADGQTVIGFEATPEAAAALPADGLTITGQSPYLAVSPDTAVVCWTCSNSQTVTAMPAGPDPAKAYFTLKAAANGMTAKKTSPTGDVEGYCFKFYSWANGTIWYAKTDANGELHMSDSNYSTLGDTTFEGFASGEYTLLEVLSRKGAGLVFPDSWRLTVTDSDGNTIYDKAYTASEMTTDANGDCRIQKAAVEGLQGGRKLTMTINNAPLTADLSIRKESPDGQIAGIEFLAADASGKEVGRGKTDRNGSLIFPALRIGQTYTVTEIVPEGYICENNDQRITITAGTNVVIFENKPLCLKLIKTSSDGNVAGIHFRIFMGDADHQSGKVWQDAATDSDGTFTIVGIKGTYWIREVVPDGYVAQEDQRIVVTDQNYGANPAIVTFENELLRGSITVNKVNTGDVPLAGATFLLEYSKDGVTWAAAQPASAESDGIGTCVGVAADGTITTGSDGKAVFSELIVYGVTYRLTEIKAPAGYQLLAEPIFTGSLTPNEEQKYELSFTVVNAPLLQMPPTGGIGDLQVFGSASGLCLSLALLFFALLMRRKNNEKNPSRIATDQFL